MLHLPLCPGGRGAVVYIDWCIMAMNTTTAYQDRNFVQLFGVSGYSRATGMSYFVPSNVNMIVLKAGKG